jgi:hypothetical protein
LPPIPNTRKERRGSRRMKIVYSIFFSFLFYY